MLEFMSMKNEELKFLYVIGIIVLAIGFVLIFLVLQKKDSEIDAQKNSNLLLQQQIDDIEKSKRTEPIFKQVENVEPKEYVVENLPANKEYIGKWKRVSMTINGIQENFASAVLEIADGSFIKTTDCVISGSLSVSENQMIMSVKNDGCKEGKNNFVSNYGLSSDNKKLTLSIDDPQFKMIEEYERINN